MSNHEASDTPRIPDWSESYCRQPRTADSHCWALKIEQQDACLAHVSPQAQHNFFEQVRNSHAAANWPSIGYFCNLEIHQALYEQIQSLLRDAAYSVDFTNSIFHTKVDFVGFEFGYGCFDEVTFFASANFRGTRFQGYASFRDTRFSQCGQSFVDAQFDADLSFACSSSAIEDIRTMVALHLSRARLMKGARFDYRHFKYDVNLNNAEIGGDLLFSDATCDGIVNLDRVKIAKPLTVLMPSASRLSLAEVHLTMPLSITTGYEGQPTGGPNRETAGLASLARATLTAPLTIGTGIVLTRCKLVTATGLDNLRVTVADPEWTVFRRRRIVRDELSVWTAGQENSIDPRHVEAVYRQLRVALEASKAAPAAADFYYGEMEMRRIASPRISFDRILLATYKIVSGYSLRLYRALLTYFIILLAVSLLLRYVTRLFVEDTVAAAGSPGLTFNRFWDVFAITARSSVTFFSPVTNGLTSAGTLLFIALRLTGPATLALAILAVRARVQR